MTACRWGCNGGMSRWASCSKLCAETPVAHHRTACAARAAIGHCWPSRTSRPRAGSRCWGTGSCLLTCAGSPPLHPRAATNSLHARLRLHERHWVARRAAACSDETAYRNSLHACGGAHGERRRGAANCLEQHRSHDQIGATKTRRVPPLGAVLRKARTPSVTCAWHGTRRWSAGGHAHWPQNWSIDISNSDQHHAPIVQVARRRACRAAWPAVACYGKAATWRDAHQQADGAQRRAQAVGGPLLTADALRRRAAWWTSCAQRGRLLALSRQHRARAVRRQPVTQPRNSSE